MYCLPPTRLWLASFLALFCLSSTTLAAEILDVSAPLKGKVITGHAYLYEDKAKSLSVDQVRGLAPEQWTLLTDDNVAYPITNSQFWLRLTLSNNQDAAVNLVLQHPSAFLHEFALYNANGELLSQSSGQQPLQRRAVYDFLPSVELSLTGHSQQTVYLLISQFYAEPITATARIFSQAEHQIAVVNGHFRDSAIIASLFSSAVIFLVFAAALRYMALILFALYTLGLSITISAYIGALRWILPVSVPTHLEPIFPLAYMLTIVFLIEFSVRYISLANHSQKLLKSFRLITFIYLLFILIGVLIGWPQSFVIKFSLSAFAIPVLLATVGWWIYLSKQRERFLLLYSCGLSIYSLGITSMSLLVLFGHPLAVKIHHQGLLVAYIAIVLDTILLIASQALWFKSQRRYRRIAEAQAQQDPLTGLLNRRGYETRLQELLEVPTAKKIWVATLDLDFFKRVNDTYGHTVGDRVLLNIADILRRLSRSDEVVARFGGEEFVICFYADSTEDARSYMERLRRYIEAKEIYIDGHNIEQTTSIGVAEVTAATPAGMTQAFTASDQALYQAKLNGRNRVEFA